MAFLFSALSVVPSFEPYTGPYRVGTVEVEFPMSKRASFPQGPDSSITTLSFRMFYPCQASSRSSKSAYWIPSPQSEYLSAYVGMSGISPALTRFLGFSARLLHHIKLPASSNADLLSCPHHPARWPVMVFSHGLGGTRNAYSRICGLLASYGIVVMALEHRDGSAPVSIIRDSTGKTKTVKYRRIPHIVSPEVDAQRNQQLNIRLWELDCAYQALLQIDSGSKSPIFLNGNSKTDECSNGVLSTFQSSLDVHRPGAISWAGHSFGAATVFQFLKSVFYLERITTTNRHHHWYTPAADAAINAQITPASTLCMLDPWLTPLQSSATRSLRYLPLPCYAPGGPGGSNVLAILSEAFFKWKAQLHLTKDLLSPSPMSSKPHHSPCHGPYIFYPEGSAHLAQSDFGILFPWVMKRILDNHDPDRILRLNLRAMLSLLRQNGKTVADTSEQDMEILSAHPPGPEALGESVHHVISGKESNGHDRTILESNGSIKGWISLRLDEESQPAEASNEETRIFAVPEEAVLETVR